MVKNMSRLKKKLLIYFLLIAIVSISVSAEMILEISSGKLKNELRESFYEEADRKLSKESVNKIKGKIDVEKVYEPIIDLRNRMILFLLVISGSIAFAFVLFARDIVYPMDCIVDATKKITAGDLTVQVPIMSKDEIGQVAGLINDMNINLQDVLLRMQQDIESHIKDNTMANTYLTQLIDHKKIDTILTSKKIKKSQLSYMLKTNNNARHLLTKINKELYALMKFLEMFKTYSIPDEITQDEIEKAIEHYNI